MKLATANSVGYLGKEADAGFAGRRWPSHLLHGERDGLSRQLAGVVHVSPHAGQELHFYDLKRTVTLLGGFRCIKAEAADFESYVDGCRVAGITSFLEPYGFKAFSRHQFAARRQGGSYQDVVYRKEQD